MTSIITSKPTGTLRRTGFHKAQLLSSLPKKIERKNGQGLRYNLTFLSHRRMQNRQAIASDVSTTHAELDVISVNNVISNQEKLEKQLHELRLAGVDGIMVDVWWGIVESKGPKRYDWSAYRNLFQLVQKHNLKIQAVMSFHQCGGNVGAAVYIPLPKWILEIGEENPDIFYTSRSGTRNKECLSLGVDNLSLFEGRTAVRVLSAGWRENIDVAGENALSRYDRVGYNQILLNSRPNCVNKNTSPKLKLSGLTYLRLSDKLLGRKNFSIFKTFVKRMHADQDYDPDHIDLPALKASKPKISFDQLLDAINQLSHFLGMKKPI